MSENVQEKQKSSKLVIILLIVLIVLVLAGIVTAVVLFGKKNNDDSSAEGEDDPAVTIGYEGAGVVALGEDEFRKTMEEMIRQAEEGMMDLRYKNIATSDDGVNFTCHIGNSENNLYDMYFNIYLGTDFEQQILLTGLVSPGSMIETFESEIPLDPGEYEATLVFTQVEDDHATMRGQVSVVITLVVSS